MDRHILDYAKMLERDHKKNLDQDQKLSQGLGVTLDENSGTAGQLQSDGSKEMAALSTLDPGKYSKEFISDMIKGHADVLNWIDNQQTQNERVKKFLYQTRKYISKHLKKAQYIQDHV
jgi:predicted outer membrane protein